jgi:hypothetical protein
MARTTKKQATAKVNEQAVKGPRWNIGLFRNDRGKLVTVYVTTEGQPVPYEERRVGGREILHFGTYTGMPYRDARQQLLADAEAAGLTNEVVDPDAIPSGFPAAKALAAAGIASFAALAEVEDLTALSGIGTKTAEAITEALEAR